MTPPGPRTPRATGRVLVVGVYLADKENWAEAAALELGASRAWAVDQRWVALGHAAPPAGLLPLTAWQERPPVPKFELINRLLRTVDLERYEHVVFTDDDIALPEGFLDRYLARVARYDLALAQPARTHDSFTDHHFVERLDGLDARRTRFVEIGPLFSVRWDAMPHLVPFDLSSPMGWGYDFAWPVTMAGARLHMGIVDATPVAHTLRPPVAHYDHGTADRAMRAYLAARPHLRREEAFTILRSFPSEAP